MKKATYKASSDVALVKYWGKKDEVLRLPENGSVSMVLSGLETITTVEFQKGLRDDKVKIEGESEREEVERVRAHLDRMRNVAGVKYRAWVVSKNTFPKGTGLSSSGSGFAALTYAGVKALGLELNQRELSILARQGSGTACRCVCGGWVEWKDGMTSETSYAETIFPADYWDVRDIVVVVDEGKKLVSSTEGHKSAQTSPFFRVRQQLIKEKIRRAKQAIKNKDFDKLGVLVEAEALEFHSILLTSKPPLIAWYPGTVEVMLAVRQMRQMGIKAYFTINTGFNVHVLTLPEYEGAVVKKMEKISLVKRVLTAKVGEGPRETDAHLF